jgi:hypothetical protein
VPDTQEYGRSNEYVVESVNNDLPVHTEASAEGHDNQPDVTSNSVSNDELFTHHLIQNLM